MKSFSTLSALSLLASLAASTPVAGALPDSAVAACTNKTPAFFLAGDSTTAVQSSGGGGWGNGFLSFLKAPAFGVNLGHNGATTASFVSGGDWKRVIDYVNTNKGKYETYVTIQFGHNDQKPDKGISLQQYQANLQKLAGEVRSAGGTPILVTPLTRRSFTSAHTLDDSLHSERLYTINAATATGTTYLDLNEASIAYVSALGSAAADKYNLKDGDRTHLNDYGSVVFGRMLADLMVAKLGTCVGGSINPNATLTKAIADKIPA